MKGVGQNFLKRLMGYFHEESFIRDQHVYDQGHDAEKVYVVANGEFEVTRKKNNMLTKKEMEYKQVRYINESRKQEEERDMAYCHCDQKALK